MQLAHGNMQSIIRALTAHPAAPDKCSGFLETSHKLLLLLVTGTLEAHFPSESPFLGSPFRSHIPQMDTWANRICKCGWLQNLQHNGLLVWCHGFDLSLNSCSNTYWLCDLEHVACVLRNLIPTNLKHMRLTWGLVHIWYSWIYTRGSKNVHYCFYHSVTVVQSQNGWCWIFKQTWDIIYNRSSQRLNQTTSKSHCRKNVSQR